MTEKKKNRHYWGVLEGSEGVGFTGTFSECWSHLVENFGEQTLADLHQQDIRITRIK